jgi:hypothetical protein
MCVDGILWASRGRDTRGGETLVRVLDRSASRLDVQAMREALRRTGGARGVLVLLRPPSRELKACAAAAGTCPSPDGAGTWPRVSPVTIEELLGAAPRRSGHATGRPRAREP